MEVPAIVGLLIAWLGLVVPKMSEGVAIAVGIFTARSTTADHYIGQRTQFVKELSAGWTMVLLGSALLLVVLIAVISMSSKAKKLIEAAALRQTQEDRPRDLPIILDGLRWVVDYRNIALRDGNAQLDRISLDAWKWVVEFKNIALREGDMQPNTSNAGHQGAPVSTAQKTDGANSNPLHVDPKILEKRQRSRANDQRMQKTMERLPLRKITEAYDRIEEPVTTSQQYAEDTAEDKVHTARNKAPAETLPPPRITKSVVALPTSRKIRSDADGDVIADKLPEGVPYMGPLLPSDVVVKHNIGPNLHVTIYRSKKIINENLRQGLGGGYF